MARGSTPAAIGEAMASARSNPGFAKRGFESWADRNLQPVLRIEAVSKRFGDFVAVDQLSLDVHQGEFFALLGPSGCGKTTLLRLIAGFEQPSAGRILLDGVELTPVPPHRRPVNMMFQSYALFPHLTAEANVAFGLKQEGLPKTEIAMRVADMLALVKLENFGRRKPHELSGGQRQRVALARSLVKRPRVLLLDEPMAALDKKLRGETQFELMELQRRLGLTFIIVTHDQTEAMTVADRIAVMDRGRLIQVAPPAEIYEQPNSRWVADFIGSVNLFEGRVADAEGAIEGTAFGRLRAANKIDAESGTTVWVAVRPEKIRLTRCDLAGNQGAAENGVVATVVDIGYLGDLSLYRLRTEAGVLLQAAIANTGPLTARDIGWNDQVEASFAPEAVIVLTR
jgi:putrescine transport system ATP-binding protein